MYGPPATHRTAIYNTIHFNLVFTIREGSLIQEWKVFLRSTLRLTEKGILKLMLVQLELLTLNAGV